MPMIKDKEKRLLYEKENAGLGHPIVENNKVIVGAYLNVYKYKNGILMLILKENIN